MRRMLTNKFTRCIAWVLTIATAMLSVPPEVLASPKNTERAWTERRAKLSRERRMEAQVKSKKVAQRVPDVRKLTAREMERITGRGSLRNSYLCGKMPWHRDFHDVNLCTGNLFKSFTDIQAAPARGAGLVLQRTYNSNDDSYGPFGHGWGHAYDIRMQEASSDDLTDEDISLAQQPDINGTSQLDKSVRTDFFGGKHVYRRDADGLYTPPPYSHNWLVSDYSHVLANGPENDINSDIDTSLDGTIKHYTDIGSIRKCDYIQDRNGNRTTLLYDGNGNLSTVTDPSERQLQFTWTNYGTSESPVWRITQVTGPESQVVTYTYYQSTNETGSGGEAYDLKTVTQYPGGSEPARTTTYTYTNVVTDVVDGNVTTECGLLSSISDPKGNTVSYEYESKTRYINDYTGGYYDTGTAWVWKITEPGGVCYNSNTNEYERRDVKYCIDVDAGGGPNNYMTIVRDGDGGLLQVIFSDGTAYRHETNLESSGIYFGGQDGVNYYNEYDGSNNVVNRFRSTSSGLWDPAKNAYGDPLRPEENTIKDDYYIYDRLGNVLYHYQIETYRTGDPLPKTPPAGRPYEQYTYHDENKYFQKASYRDMNGKVTTYDYDSHGNLTSVTDPLNHSFTYTYNSYGQKLTETNVNGVVTQYTYGDDWGNLTQVVQDYGSGHLNRTTSMEYDEAGRVLSRTDPMNRTSTVSYNYLGQPLQASFPATYDNQQQIVTPAETVSYDYGINGRLESVSDTRGSNTSTTTLTYEDEVSEYNQTGIGDRVASVDDNGKLIEYTYNASGSIATKTINNETIEFCYIVVIAPRSGPPILPNGISSVLKEDDPNSLAEVPLQIKDGSGNVIVDYYVNPTGSLRFALFNEKYDSNNALIECCRTDYYLYGTQDDSDIFSNGWLGSVVTNHYQISSGGNWQPTQISENDYTYDNVGNRLTNTITDQNGTSRVENYTYDDLNRLSTVNYGSGTQTYGYDNMGNRTSLNGESYTYNAANMLLTKGAASYTNDANGNQLTGGGRINIWDSQNRLVQCAYNGHTSTFTYGADGLRRSMTVDGATTQYILDGQNVAKELEYNTLNQQIGETTYMLGSRGIEYRKHKTIDPGTGGTSEQLVWYVYDGLGSVVVEVDEDYNITRAPALDVYGNKLNPSETDNGTSKHRFCGSLGHTSEPDTGGLIYMRARWMDPATGRFISEDPAKDGVNWSAYCDNNPVNLSDATGKVVGADDYLNAEGETGTASVRGGMSFIQKLCDAIEKQMVNQLEGLGAKVERIGLQANKGAKAGDFQQYVWRIQRGGTTRTLRLDWSGHGGMPTHWNIKGPLNHAAFEAFDDVMSWMMTGL